MRIQRGWSYVIGRKYTHGRNEDGFGEIEMNRIESEARIIIYHEIIEYSKMFHTWRKTTKLIILLML